MEGDYAMKKLNSFIFIFCLIMILSSLSAETYFVDADRPDDSGSGLSWGVAKQTIAAAINGSGEGDTILVKYGIYPIQSFITISSERMITSDNGSNVSWDSAIFDSSQCVLSADSSRIFTIISDTVTAATRIRGFKITGGDATEDTVDAAHGGGILIKAGADPVIERCWIIKNTGNSGGEGYGGGLSIRDTGTEPTIQYCRIDSNTAATGSGYGGGIHSDTYSAPVIHHNMISNNLASSDYGGNGGGIYCYNSYSEIYSNSITYNIGTPPGIQRGGTGGGIAITSANIQIYDNEILYNCASKSMQGIGGGIYIDMGAHEVWNNHISHNIAGNGWDQGAGGGIRCRGAHLRDNIITYNIATTSEHSNELNRRGYGGGICCDGSGDIVENNTIVHNIASVYGMGGGGGISASTAQTFRWNIIAHNIASDSSDGYGGGMYSGNAANSIISNNTFYQNSNIGSNSGTGSGTGSQLYNYTTGGSYNFDTENNIFYGHNLAVGDCTAVYSSVDENMQIKNCCFFNSSRNYNQNVHSENEILDDPYFVYPDTGNFDLKYMSACIDAGTDFYEYNENENHDLGWKVDIGAREYTGVRVAKVISDTDTGTVYFGGQVRAKMYINSIDTVTKIDITVHPGENPPSAAPAVQRWYEIAGTDEEIDFDLTLSYKDSELNGHQENLLQLWYWTGSNWNNPGSTVDTSTSENWLIVANQSSFGNWAIAEGDITGLNSWDQSQQVISYQLSQNYPNPFNSSTLIKFTLARDTYVTLDIYNILGQKIRNLISKRISSGNHSIKFNAQDFPSGIYFYKIKSGDFQQIKKMILIK
jgi:hypothetical protein